jgi:hypothetical protein
MADKHLYIRYKQDKSDKHGWRVTYKNEDDEEVYQPNPSVPSENDTVVWHAPQDAFAHIVFLPDSPFVLPKGEKKVLDLKPGEVSEAVEIKKGLQDEKTYEYAVLVRLEEGNYTYVRGAESPPGIAVGP